MRNLTLFEYIHNIELETVTANYSRVDGRIHNLSKQLHRINTINVTCKIHTSTSHQRYPKHLVCFVSGTSLIVMWENVHLQDDEEGKCSFYLPITATT